MVQPNEEQSKLIDKSGNFQLANRGSAIADLTGTAGGTYGNNEQDQINNLRVALNTLLAKIRAHGLIED